MSWNTVFLPEYGAILERLYGRKQHGSKKGIVSSFELAGEEERISKKKGIELFERGTLDKLEPGKLVSL